MSHRKASYGARSLPYKRPYIAAIFFAFLHFLSLVATGTFAYILIRTGDPKIADLLIGSVVGIGVTWLISYICRRSTRCPLCSGTPLLDTAAVKHRKAVRFRPLNYGASAQLSLCFTQQFRCMYCGTPYDLSRDSDRRKDYSQSEDS